MSLQKVTLKVQNYEILTHMHSPVVAVGTPVSDEQNFSRQIQRNNHKFH